MLENIDIQNDLDQTPVQKRRRDRNDDGGKADIRHHKAIECAQHNTRHQSQSNRYGRVDAVVDAQTGHHAAADHIRRAGYVHIPQ